jgi:hypothetical protein
MPATFPSHAGFVLPLKLWRPAWFDGVALVVGSTLPDLPYVGGCCGPPQTYGHTWWGTVALVPVGLVLAWFVRWAAPTVAAHLPMAGPLALRDYGVIGVTRPRWWTTVPCVWLGALSHLLTDHVTHASLAGTGLGIPALGAEVVAGVPWFIVVHLVASALGAVAWLAITVHIGRNRLLVRWHGPPPERPVRPRLFWGTIAVVALAGVVAASMPGTAVTDVGGMHLPHPAVLVNRVGVALFVALLVGTAAARPRDKQVGRSVYLQ